MADITTEELQRCIDNQAAHIEALQQELVDVRKECDARAEQITRLNETVRCNAAAHTAQRGALTAKATELEEKVETLQFLLGDKKAQSHARHDVIATLLDKLCFMTKQWATAVEEARTQKYQLDQAHTRIADLMRRVEELEKDIDYTT